MRLLLLLLLAGCKQDYVLGDTSRNTQPQTQTPTCEVGDWPYQPGVYRRQVTHQQTQRGYSVRIPSGYDPCKTSPVVVILRGEGAFAASDTEPTFSPFLTRADEEGYVLVYPEATAVGVRAEWNAPLGPLILKDVDDVGFVSAVLGDLRGRDPERTFALGLGEGETFGHSLVAQLPVFAGFIGVGGVLGGRRIISGDLEIPPTPVQPLSVLLVHGRDDSVFPIEGGVVAGRFLLGTDAAELFWVKANSCNADPEINQNGIATTHYHACLEGREVTTIALENVGHQVPEDAINLRFRLSEVAFNFFARNSP